MWHKHLRRVAFAALMRARRLHSSGPEMDMRDGTHRRVRILLPLVALVLSTIPVRTDFPPGSTVPFGQQIVGTSSAEIQVATVLYFSPALNTVQVNVFGNSNFFEGSSSTCPTSPAFLSADCVVTVVFAPTSAGLKQGTVKASYGACFPSCPAAQIWNLTGTGVLPPPPAAPTQLGAQRVSSSQITLAWNDTSTNESGFHIERSTSSTGPFAQVVSTNANVNSYLDSTLAPSTTYFYRVQAFNSGGTSGYSNVASATTPSSDQVSDTTPPHLVGESFTPTLVDVTAGAQTVTVMATVTDDIAGTIGVSVQFVSPSGTQREPLNTAFLSRISGDDLNGVYRGTVSIPQFSETGTWKLGFLRLQDAAGNFVTLNAANLQALSQPTDLAVVSLADTHPPNITNITMSPSSIDVSAGPQSLAVSLTLADDISGVDLSPDRFLEFRLTFRSSSGRQQQYMARQDFILTSGNTLNGTWQATHLFPQFSEAGVWTISQVQVVDFAGNQRSFSSANLAALGLLTNFTVFSSVSDTTPPQVTGLTFTPSVIDTSAQAQNVTVTITISDDLAGTSFAEDHPAGISFLHGVLFSSPSGGQSRQACCTSFSLIAGTPLNGTWRGTVFFPQFSEGGTWKAQLIGIQDAVHNSVNLSTANLVSMGLPTDLIIFQPSSVPDCGTSGLPACPGSGGGTVMDAVFGARASLTFPAGLLSGPTTAALDVLSSNLNLPTPAGMSAGTLFVNIALTPTPVMPFPPPGVSLVLPFSTFKTPGSPINLYRLDPASGLLVLAPSVAGGFVVGTVNADGLSATFTGVAHLSTVVGFFPTAVVGDVDGDGVVNCTDLAIVKASFGKRTGQVGFDVRADLNRNGIVDINDLALVSRTLPVGTSCSAQ